MFDKIEKMRNKSFGERKRATFFISVGLTAVIVFVWGTVVLPRTLTLGSESSSRADTLTPFKALSEDIGLIFNDIKTGVDELGEGFSGLMDKEEGLGTEESADEGSEIPATSPRGDVDVDAGELRGTLDEEGTIESRTIELESGTILEIEG